MAIGLGERVHAVRLQARLDRGAQRASELVSGVPVEGQLCGDRGALAGQLRVVLERLRQRDMELAALAGQ